ncbi:PREDICTED: uncharacterized protein LOC109129679 [Camelina sativa]|uniref:Uncharacterized protein LOC109125566 n=1 Tax=Camelina sativa TaxID=90675 RepID=A0ABM1Q881_CAMSA|nr:PREDICTED: uncharacterized protein LOC109125566 [Camelina sativa]XP_019093797.1 PREDICTED: uncharacterized protein LOC109129679 [Camelina sativa]
MGMSKKLMKAIIIYVALIMVFFTFATLKTNAQEVIISYDALAQDHAWGCSPKYPNLPACQKEKVNP